MSTNHKLIVVAVFALALAWVEASVVVYLRAIYYPDGFAFPLTVIPASMITVELLRELAMIAVLFGSLLLAFIKPKNRAVPREAVIGILYAMALVVSLLLTDKLPDAEAYVTTTLAGSLLWVNWSLVGVTAFVYIALLFFHYAFRHKFIALAENPQSLGNERLWDFLFFTTQGIITVLIVPIAGVLLAYAFLMIPAATAAMFTKKWAKAVLIGWATGLVACILGLGSSYFYNLPYGPTLVLFLGLFFVCAMVLRCVISRCGANPKERI